MLKMNIVRLPHAGDLDLPKQGTPLSAGLDLSAAIEGPLTLNPGQRFLVPTGFSIALPPGYEGQIRSRSGLSFKHGLVVLNSPGTIDADYRGEIKVLLINFGEEPFQIERGMRIAQLVVNKVENVSWTEVMAHTDLETLNRNEAGFGSTGIHQQSGKS
ncbi:dUTP diphosphatase [Candidatus Bealeia paramacronuclearis]|uniref:Deoxyuridine 5'-triphosphate nucleotidohydrolase n=1 Tax=Candidatus Bealeia paramacronuclearis TaxID=1921001 RepID=A0ABZ2C517_9PROT|nr:dUTP diphosphatase [Candidatus Bealeia paramacronuclearis]